jgi:DNA-binding transcriptional MerR regulator
MRISELSRLSGVSVATIKYYIREQLLPPGRPTAATQAEYDEHHVRRLRLVRALIGVRGLSVEATRELLQALSQEQSSPHIVLGLALGAIRPPDEPREDREELAVVDSLIKELGWRVHQDAHARSVLVETLASLKEFGFAPNARSLLSYARLAEQTATLDLDQLDGVDDPAELAERAIVLTTLLEPALMALRRLAQEHESAKRYGD